MMEFLRPHLPLLMAICAFLNGMWTMESMARKRWWLAAFYAVNGVLCATYFLWGRT
jgi:hypothetical protein